MDPPVLLRSGREVSTIFFLIMIMTSSTASGTTDTNPVFNPCSDTTVQRWDGFTFGVAMAAKDKLAPPNEPQFSPCDPRLKLAAGGSELAVFRPKVDELSLLSFDPIFNPSRPGALYMVAFAGSKYAARSSPVFVGDAEKVVPNLALVLEFQKGILNNLYWRTKGCNLCDGICADQQSCAVPVSKCKSKGGSIDCTVGIQLAFSGTDKNFEVLNSWYEVENLSKSTLSSLFGDQGPLIHH